MFCFYSHCFYLADWNVFSWLTDLFLLWRLFSHPRNGASVKLSQGKMSRSVYVTLVTKKKKHSSKKKHWRVRKRRRWQRVGALRLITEWILWKWKQDVELEHVSCGGTFNWTHSVWVKVNLTVEATWREHVETNGGGGGCEHIPAALLPVWQLHLGDVRQLLARHEAATGSNTRTQTRRAAGIQSAGSGDHA